MPPDTPMGFTLPKEGKELLVSKQTPRANAEFPPSGHPAAVPSQDGSFQERHRDGTRAPGNALSVPEQLPAVGTETQGTEEGHEQHKRDEPALSRLLLARPAQEATGALPPRFRPQLRLSRPGSGSSPGPFSPAPGPARPPGPAPARPQRGGRAAAPGPAWPQCPGRGCRGPAPALRATATGCAAGNESSSQHHGTERGRNGPQRSAGP